MAQNYHLIGGRAHILSTTYIRNGCGMKGGSLWLNWILFISLAIIWGSSFMLMKLGIRDLTPVQVASMRIIASGMVLLPIAYRAFRRLTLIQQLFAFVSGLLGSFFPAYLFCIAETRVDSALAGMLNALTPVFVILIGVLFYKLPVSWSKISGVAVALAGSVLLLFAQTGFNRLEHPLYAGMIVLATLCYGWNVNLVKKHLSHVNALDVVAVALVGCSVPSLWILFSTGFPVFSADQGFIISLSAAVVLGIAGTALASVLFYKLIRSAGVVFASMVTYAIPVVAILWGLVFRESLGWAAVGCLLIILAGVYWANRAR